MAKKNKEDVEIKEIEATIPALSPLYSNIVRVMAHTDFILLDFGFIAPSYFEPYSLQDKQIGRICLDWDACVNLLHNLKDVVADHAKEQKSKQKKAIK